jgi:hypothetical protein
MLSGSQIVVNGNQGMDVVTPDRNGQRIAGERRLGKNIKLNEIVAGSHIRKYLFV